MTHSFAFWAVVWPVVAAAAIYPIRGKWLSGALASLVSIAALWLARVWPAGNFWVLGYRISAAKLWSLAGGTFRIFPARNWLLMTYAVLLSIGILAIFLDSYRKALVWAFVWGAALTAMWTSVGVLQMFFMLSVVSALAVFGIAGAPHARGAWRAMLFPSFSYPLALIAMWYASQVSLNPEASRRLLYDASMLISAAVFLSLMIFPFHGAFPAVGEESNPPAGFVWFALWPAAVWSVVIRAHQSLSWWRAPSWASWVELSLLGTLILVAAAGFWQKSPGRVLGYVVLAMWTLFLQSGSFGSMGILPRGAGLAIAVFGLVMLRDVPGPVPFRLRKAWKAVGAAVYLAGIIVLIVGIWKSAGTIGAHRGWVYAAALSLLVGSLVSSQKALAEEGFSSFWRTLLSGRVLAYAPRSGRPKDNVF